MLRKVLVSTNNVAALAKTSTGINAKLSSSSASLAAAPFRTTNTLLMMQNRSVQNQWTQDNVTHAGRRSDYDFDKEQWAKQMKFASFDCIMEPSIIPPKYTSFEGIKKNIRRYLNMKKLAERRPGYNPKDLELLFTRYKYLTKSKDNSDSTLLLRLTTHTEAARIEKEISKRANEEFKQKSWGSMKLDLKKGAGTKNTPAAAKNSTSGSANTNAAAADNADPALVAAANNANDVVLMIKKPPHYDIHITDFQLVTSYMAQMAAEDWLQLTFKCEYLEKDITADANANATGGAVAAKQPEGMDKAEFEKSLLAQGYTKVLEYPCFELRMGDGVAGGVQYPFIVLGVMRRDGTRYGRDAQDAAQLRKQFDRNRSWFS